jgi:hypothetical protein
MNLDFISLLLVAFGANLRNSPEIKTEKKDQL